MMKSVKSNAKCHSLLMAILTGRELSETYVDICAWEWEIICMWESEDKCRRKFSPATTQVPGMEHGSPGWAASTFNQLSHLMSSCRHSCVYNCRDTWVTCLGYTDVAVRTTAGLHGIDTCPPCVSHPTQPHPLSFPREWSFWAEGHSPQWALKKATWGEISP